MNDAVKWIHDNQLLLSYLSCFLVLSYLFDILWAFVLLFTFELVEDNFNFNLFPHTKEEDDNDKELLRNRKYKFDKSAGSTNECFSEMYSREERQFGNGRWNGPKKQGELTPSLISLIHKGRINNKGNMVRDSQPLVAIVKNNMHIRQHTHIKQSPKSPLYRNRITTSAQKRKSASSFNNYASPSVMVHQNSGWFSPFQATTNTSFGAVRSPSVTLNRSAYDKCAQDANLNNSALQTPALEVHGSYFLNKSLLHSNLVEDEPPNFSLVNSSFKSSPAKRVESIGRIENRQNGTSFLDDDTSTEAVISMLKEKSKRKRQYYGNVLDDSEPVFKYRKRVTMQKSDDFNDTLDGLFPPASCSTAGIRKRVSSIRTSNKRTSTVGTQYESVENNETSAKKKVCSSPGRKKLGLSEEQTDELMGDEVNTSNDAIDVSLRQSVESEELENAVNHVKESLAKYKESNKHKVTFSLDTPNVKEDAFSTPVKSIEENGDEGATSKYSILKSLKSPYKKIFHSPFPSNLTPGSAERRRKHPVYFTAKIDIDEIQSNREEYGERGASLKAFRLDIEEAKQRANSLLDDPDEVDFKLKGTTAISSVNTISSSFSLPTASLLSATSSSTTETSVATGLLSALKKITTTSITLGTSTVPTTTAGKNVSFNFPISSSDISTASGTFGLPFSTSNSTSLPAAVKTTIANAAPLAASTVSTVISIPASLENTAISSAPNGFSLGTKNTEPCASDPSVSTQSIRQQFSFENITVSSAVSASNTSFSFTNTNATSQSTTAPFNFGPKTTAAEATARTANQFSMPASGAAISTQPISTNPGNPTFQFVAQPSAVVSTSTLFQATTSTANANSSIFVSNTAAQPTNLFNVQTTKAFSSSTTGFSFKSAQAPLTYPMLGVPATTISNVSNPTTAPNLFGSQNPVVQQSASASIFAPAATSTKTNLFTATPSTTSVFAAGQPPPPYGASTTTSTTQDSNLFATKPSQTFSFNQAATTSGGSTKFNFAVKPSTAPSIFGTPASTQTPFAAPVSDSIFGTAPSQNAFQVPSNVTTSSANVFGPVPQNTGTVFGNLHAANSVFGQTQNNKSKAGAFQFGAQNATPTFGANTAATTKSTFAFGTTSTASTANSVFGQPTTTASVFGQPSSTVSVFGQPATGSASVFGQPTTSSSVFGQPTTSSSVFGRQNSSNIFGNSAIAAAPSVFGSTINTNTAPTPFGSNPSSGPVFGNANNTASAPNPFGQAPANKPGGFDFSASLQGPSLSFGGSTGSAFGGQVTPAKSSFNFGSQPSVPSFGTPTAPAFGAQQFGAPQQFGFTSPAASRGGFTIGQGTTNPPRHTQRARRRLKK